MEPGACSPIPGSPSIAPEIVLSPPASEPSARQGVRQVLRPSAFPRGSLLRSIISPEQPVTPPGRDLAKWRFHFRLDTSVTYDDNIFIQPSQRQSDVYFGISPYLAAGWGFQAEPGNITGTASRFPQIAERRFGNAFFFAPPTAVFFTDHTDQNSFNEDVLVSGRWISGKLTAEAEGRFQTLSAPNIGVGTRINNEVASGLLNLNYQVTQKTSLDSRFSMEHDSYQGGLNSTDTSVSSILNYQALPKTTVGLGGSFGYTTVESGQDQYYQAGTPPSALPSHLQDHAGPHWRVAMRQIQNGPNRATPVFDFELGYAAHESTTLSLKVSRQTDTSALYEDQDIEGTKVEGRVRQRLFQEVFLTLSGGYQHSAYVNAGAAASRTDNYFFVGVESALEVTKWLSMRASYQFQQNDSSFVDFGFQRNLASFQLDLRF